MNKFLYLIIILNALAFKAGAFVISTDTIKDRLTVGLDYASNSFYAGYASGLRLPYLSPNIVYKRASGIWFSAAGYKLLDQPEFVNEVDLTAGYDFKLKKKYYFSLNYTRLWFNEASVVVKSTIRNNYEIYTGKYFKKIFASIQADYSTGLSRDLFIRTKASKYWGSDSLFSKHDAISFDPEIMLTLGTRNFYEAHVEYITVTSPTAKKGKGKGATSTNVVYTKRTSFAANNFQLNLPLTYTYKDWAFEAALHWVFPLNDDYLYARRFISLSVYYNFYRKRGKGKL